MAISKEQALAYLSRLSPDELGALILELEDLWHMPPPGSPWAHVSMGAPLDPTMGMAPIFEFDVVLLGAGGARVAVMKALRSLLGITVREAKALVDGAPVAVAEARGREDAEAMQAALLAAGAEVELR